MSAQIFLIVPPDLEPARLPPVLAEAEVSALLLRRGAQSENGYKDWVRRIAPLAQSAGSAVLIEGEPGWVHTLGVDGIHVTGPLEAVHEATTRLKPDLIVGADATRSRHEAMSRGELDIDYLLFGPLSGTLDEAEADMAAWWAEVMELPAVLSDPTAHPDAADPRGCEFLALSDSLWNAGSGAGAAATAFARRLEALK